MLLYDTVAKTAFNAFPLGKLSGNWTGYFIATTGQIYSNKQTKQEDHVKKMHGKRVSGLNARTYTLSGVSQRSDRLLALAKRSLSWARDTELAAPQLPEEAKPQWPFPIDKATSDAYRGKKPDVLQAVKDRGFVIASIVDNKLVFGSEPKIHSTVMSVEAELGRLAAASPGTVFVRLDITGAGFVPVGLTRI